MKTFWNRGWKIGVLVWFLIIACNMPFAVPQAATEPPLSAQEIAATAIELTLTAAAGNAPADTPVPTVIEVTATTQPTATDAFTSTPCVGTVTANNVDVNVRSGPATAYAIVGALPNGTSARVYGQNDARTWWYIEFPAGTGHYAWVSGSVTTASCIPDNLQYVAAPPLPTATLTPVISLLPDLYVSEYAWLPVPPHMGVAFHVRVGVYNQGDGPSSAFTVKWWLSSLGSPSCSWNVPSLVAHGGKILQCSYTPGGWNNAYPSLVVVDTGNDVAESNEGNNTQSAPLQVAP